MNDQMNKLVVLEDHAGGYGAVVLHVPFRIFVWGSDKIGFNGEFHRFQKSPSGEYIPIESQPFRPQYEELGEAGLRIVTEMQDNFPNLGIDYGEVSRHSLGFVLPLNSDGLVRNDANLQETRERFLALLSRATIMVRSTIELNRIPHGKKIPYGGAFELAIRYRELVGLPVPLPTGV